MNQQNLNPPANVRSVLYVVIMLGGPIIAYLQIKHPEIIGTAELALWTALTSAVALMAGLNVASGPTDQGNGGNG